MAYYIRFLKVPKFDGTAMLPDRALFRALITITTDLGDAFYPGNLSVCTSIYTSVGKISLGLTSWRPGTRCLEIKTQVPIEYLRSPARLLFTCGESQETDSLHVGKVPYVISAWTEVFSGPQYDIANVVIRRLHLQEGKVLDICEDVGESIACHIWDAALAMTAWLIFNRGKIPLPEEEQPAILELGTGCGMVGLVLASLHPKSRLILTDEDDRSLQLAARNALKSREVFNSVWECRTLDWKEPQKFFLDRSLGLIVASDCTYNSDSIPDLVQTMADLVRRSVEIHKGAPSPKILVSTKRRHASEGIFLELMGKSGFKYKRSRLPIGQGSESVDIYIFEQPTEA